MSLLTRSPTGVGGGSEPNLSRLRNVEEDSITIRKRKRECDCHQDVNEFRSELRGMATLLEQFIESNTLSMSQVQSNIADVKAQIIEIKASNEQTLSEIRENIADVKIQLNDVKASSSTMVTEQKNIKTHMSELENKLLSSVNKITTLETELHNLKLAPSADSSTLAKAEPRINEQLIREVQERNEREKNIIIVGIPEQSSANVDERISKDEAEVMNITSSMGKKLPKPVKVFRIGKYTAGKNRRIKVCYDTPNTAKQLLRNRDKLPSNIKIFSDQTPAQQKYLKDLKEELVSRQNNGENDLTIKYSNGVPSIINANALSKNSKQ